MVLKPGIGMPMNHRAMPTLFRKLAILLVAGVCIAPPPCLAADDAPAPKGAAVTVLKAAKSCFAAIVEVSGILIPKDETFVRPDRQGLKVADVVVDAGETVTAGQTLARLTLPEGGMIVVQTGRRPRQQLNGGNRRRRLGQGRAAVQHHPPQRVRSGRPGAGA
jgi:hypothetical protein